MNGNHEQRQGNMIGRKDENGPQGDGVNEDVCFTLDATDRHGSDSAVVEIKDAVEDAKNGKDLLNRIQKMKLLRKFTLDRENDKRIRFKGTDCWGNVSYLEIIR